MNLGASPMENAAITTLSIIGTAGRGDDYARLDRAVYDRMADVARSAVRRLAGEGPLPALVSGGAAWADHLAVRLALEGVVEPNRLTLHLPAPFVGRAFDEAVKDGGTSNYYHRRFSQKTGVKSLDEVAAVIAAGATVTTSAGFFARNVRVAGSDALLAFTFGGGQAWGITAGGPTTTAREAGLKDGGTAHTWDRSRSSVKLHVSLG